MGSRANALPTDQLTDRPTDTASYKGALSHLKWEKNLVTSQAEQIVMLAVKVTKFTTFITAKWQMTFFS